MRQRPIPLLALLSVAAFASPSSLLAAVLRVGAEQPASVSAQRQRSPAVALADNGSGLVVWENANQGVVGRLIDAEGVPVGNEIVLVANRILSGLPAEGEVVWRKEPAAVAAPGGGFFVFWTEERVYVKTDIFWEDRQLLDRDVRGQRFDAQGQPAGPRLRVHPESAGLQSSPQALRGPDWIALAWHADDLLLGSAGDGLFARVLESDGSPRSGVFRVSKLAAGAAARRPALALDPAGDLWLVWESPGDGSGEGIFVRRFNDLGEARGPVARVNAVTVGCQRYAALAAHPDGGFLALWHGPSAEADGWRIYGRRLDPVNAALGTEFEVSPGDHESELYPSIAAVGEGRYVVVWMSWFKNFPQGFYGVELDRDGGTVGEPARLHQFRAYTQFRTALATAPGGRAVAVWETLAPRQKKAGISLQRLGVGE
jgi:hypothetical protein